MKNVLQTKNVYPILLVLLSLLASDVAAITPCPPDPCKDEASTSCEQDTDWIADGVIAEVHTARVDRNSGISHFPGIGPRYEVTPVSITFLPHQVVSGTPPPGHTVLGLLGCFYDSGSFEQMRSVRITARVRKSGQGWMLVHFKRSAASTESKSQERPRE